MTCPHQTQDRNYYSYYFLTCCSRDTALCEKKNCILEEIHLINKRTADALRSHKTNKSRGLLGDSWSSALLQRGSPKLRGSLGIHRMFWAAAHSPLAPHSWLGPVSTPPSHSWGTWKAHHLAAQEKVVGGIEVKQHYALFIFSLSGRYWLSPVQEGHDFWVLTQQQQQCSLKEKKKSWKPFTSYVTYKQKHALKMRYVNDLGSWRQNQWYFTTYESISIMWEDRNCFQTFTLYR